MKANEVKKALRDAAFFLGCFSINETLEGRHTLFGSDCKKAKKKCIEAMALVDELGCED